MHRLDSSLGLLSEGFEWVSHKTIQLKIFFIHHRANITISSSLLESVVMVSLSFSFLPYPLMKLEMPHHHLISLLHLKHDNDSPSTLIRCHPHHLIEV